MDPRVKPETPDDFARVARVRYAGEQGELEEDSVAREEPLEIQLGGAPLAVLMRTPGHDPDLALGFLVTERVVASPAQVTSARHCRQVSDPDASENVIRVVLAPGVCVDLDALRRNLYASSSCGICGKATIANALASAPPLTDESRFDTAFFPPLPQRLQAAQPAFAVTGGLHAAGLFAPDGRLLVVREDVGRHNAVDKVIGRTLLDGATTSDAILLVSGRTSFEILQKAAVAGIPIVCAVSGPTTLAIETAQAFRITLINFLRGGDMSIAACPERVVGL